MLLVLVFAAAASAALVYAANNLGINTDTADMISERLPFRMRYSQFRDAFPFETDRFVVVIDGVSPEQSDELSQALASGLAARTNLYSDVHVAGAGDYFERNALLFADEAELTALADGLIDMQPFLGYLNQDPSLVRLAELLEQAANNSDRDLPLETFLIELNAVLAAAADDRPRNFSWQRVMFDDSDPDSSGQRFVSVKPILDFSEPLAAEAAMLALRAMRDQILAEAGSGPRIRITGDAALGYEELVSAMGGAQLAGLLALVMVAIILTIGLGSAWLVLASMLTLIAGLSLTAGYATWAVGHLNLISIAFAVLYIGLGVDYAIHTCLRYRELLQSGEDKTGAIIHSVMRLSGSFVICTLTTAIAFFAFVPTAFAGVSELGLIAGGGMFINLACSMSLLPAFLLLMPEPSATPPNSGTTMTTLGEWPLRHAAVIRKCALLVGLAAIAALPFVSFDRNPLNLRDPHSESVATVLALMNGERAPVMHITVLSDSESEAQELARKLKALPDVDAVQSIDDLLPAVDDEKLLLIDELAIILAPSLVPPASRPVHAPAETRRAFIAVGDTLAALGSGQAAPVSTLARAAGNRIDALAQGGGDAVAVNIEHRVFRHFDARITRLQRALNPDRKLSVQSIPNDIRSRWVNADGMQRLAVFPTEDINGNQALRSFVESVQTIAPDATDEPVLSLLAGDAVVTAFQQAFGAALILIALILLALFRDLKAMLLVLAPLMLAALLTVACMVLLGVPFNFANVIALPLLLGIGVDNGIHLVHRARFEPDAVNPLQSSTARAILFASLTTACSFGNLLVSPHPGTASMGLLLATGIIMTIVCTLIVLPAWLLPGRSA